jgi:hypothetical protein
MLDELWESRWSVAFLCLPSQLGFLLPFLLCLEKKRFVVWRAASTHRYRE